MEPQPFGLSNGRCDTIMTRSLVNNSKSRGHAWTFHLPCQNRRHRLTFVITNSHVFPRNPFARCGNRSRLSLSAFPSGDKKSHTTNSFWVWTHTASVVVYLLLGPLRNNFNNIEQSLLLEHSLHAYLILPGISIPQVPSLSKHRQSFI